MQGPTENLSKIVDFWLRPVVEQLPSYVKDSSDMLRIIENLNDSNDFSNKNVYLVCLDVVNLYGNIPHEDAIEAITFYHHKFHLSLGLPPLDAILTVVNHVLDNNVFTFENVVYKQIQGIAMGIPMASSIANLVMGMLEEKLLNECPVKVDPKLWKRFIDDVFLVFIGSSDDLQSLLSFVNTLHRTLKFTSHFSTTSESFLDLEIKLKDGLLSTNMHIKDTDSQNYIHYKPCHPKHCLNNIPYSQALRARRICATRADFEKQASRLSSCFLRRLSS